MSAVWQHFALDAPTSKTATCNICHEKISRGGTSVANFNTSNLIKHLKMRHAKEHDEFTKAKGKKKNEPQQQTLEAAFQRRDKLSRDSPKATKITDKIVEFIVLNDQPLSVVENVEFRRLMEHLEPRYCLPGRKYISETALPKLYEAVGEHILYMLKDVHAVSFTTDIWSSDVCPMSLLSLTSHWVDRESTFTPQSAVLHASEFRGSRTGTLIAEAIERMLVQWKIPKSNVHVVLRDNASNMKKAMDEMDMPSLGCYAHTLQLVVHEGLLSQRSVSDALANGRKIVAHFKHSPLATTCLEEIQKDLKMPTKRLHQDIATRWNSTYYMVKSLLEQKRSISAYGADHDLPVTLTANQWALLEKTITVLAPFEELTRQMSSSTSSAAEVIPSVTVLKRLLARENEEDTGIKTMKTTLLEAVQKRFKTIENEPLHAVATLLEPRFKDRYFTESIEHAKDALTQEVEKMEALLSSRTTPEGAEAVPSNPSKAPRMEGQPDDSSSSSSRKSSLKGLFEEILQEHDEERGASSTSTQVQIQTYLTEQTIPRSDSHFQYWGVNQIRFPTLAATAAKFLCALSTSVDSERLFSVASNIVDV